MNIFAIGRSFILQKKHKVFQKFHLK